MEKQVGKITIFNFEMVSELNAWNDTVKAIQLATSLRGVAQQVLSDVPPIYRKDFNYLVHTLSQRFEPRNQSELFRAKKRTDYVEEENHSQTLLTKSKS